MGIGRKLAENHLVTLRSEGDWSRCESTSCHRDLVRVPLNIKDLSIRDVVALSVVDHNAIEAPSVEGAPVRPKDSHCPPARLAPRPYTPAASLGRESLDIRVGLGWIANPTGAPVVFSAPPKPRAADTQSRDRALSGCFGIERSVGSSKASVNAKGKRRPMGERYL